MYSSLHGHPKVFLRIYSNAPVNALGFIYRQNHKGDNLQWSINQINRYLECGQKTKNRKEHYMATGRTCHLLKDCSEAGISVVVKPYYCKLCHCAVLLVPVNRDYCITSFQAKFDQWKMINHCFIKTNWK